TTACACGSGQCGRSRGIGYEHRPGQALGPRLSDRGSESPHQPILLGSTALGGQRSPPGHEAAGSPSARGQSAGTDGAVRMTAPQLFPKPPKRMRQPPKDLLREQLATAADEIIRLRAENDHLNQRM